MTRELKFAHAPTRLARTWTNELTTWPHLLEQLQNPHRDGHSRAEYQALTKTQQGEVKDAHGGFVGGHLDHGQRKKHSVHARSLITLDLDTPPVDLLERLPELLPCEWFCYSTHSHTPEQPRLRVIIPLTRDVTTDEYTAVARRVGADIGIDYLDDTTYEAHRLMYWPSHPYDIEPVKVHHEGPWLDPDKQLGRFDDWTDMSTWPTSSRQTTAVREGADKQVDPTEKPGLIGAFCRTYSIEKAIETYLADVYLPAPENGRYTYLPGETASGVVLYDGKFAYSWHGTDPAGGQLCNAFDLVRIHLFGEEDAAAKPDTPTNRLPSFKLMQDKATADKEVRKRLAAERLQDAAADFDNLDTTDRDPKALPEVDDWVMELDLGRNEKPKDTLNNHVLILRHDQHLAGIAYNEHRDAIDVKDDHPLPWKQIRPGWTDTDFANLKIYVEKVHGLYSPTKTKEALIATSAERAYHPVRDYLGALPEWDGTQRIDTLLIDYLGAPDNAYTRAVTRKTLVAAVARVKHPGVKFDQVLILNGPQGIGKSTIFAKLGKQWFSDALTLTDMRDKSGAEKLQGNWINELGELAGMRKMEVETVKSFISKTEDKYRAAYGTVVEAHPRQCIIVGSTNAESGFLRDSTGNRRFWPVAVTGDSPKHTWDLTDDTIDQLWAEALAAYKEGEKLYLSGDLADDARRAQDAAIETDDRLGMVAEYLDRPLPAGWEGWDSPQRRAYLHGGGGEFVPSAPNGADTTDTEMHRRETVTNAEIWVECFNRDLADLKPQDSYAIAAIMQKIDGWEKAAGNKARVRIHPYGMQRIYRRKEEEQPLF